jgi:hypothetical protein
MYLPVAFRGLDDSNFVLIGRPDVPGSIQIAAVDAEPVGGAYQCRVFDLNALDASSPDKFAQLVSGTYLDELSVTSTGVIEMSRDADNPVDGFCVQIRLGRPAGKWCQVSLDEYPEKADGEIDTEIILTRSNTGMWHTLA